MHGTGPADRVMRSPREVALRILEDRFGTPDPPSEPTFVLADFQERAVHRIEALLRRRRGAILADSVGLGKTYVALAVIERALERGERVIVTAPATLRRNWTAPLRSLRRRYRLDEAHGLDAAHPVLGDVDRDPPPRTPSLAWISHAKLSRDGGPGLGPAELVVVDEAHAFRSPMTRRYRALAALCRGARVLLITATPVNNSVWDLYFQLRLFAGDDEFRDLGVPDLREATRAAEGSRSAAPAPALLRAVTREIVVRRTRALVRGTARTLPDGGTLRFPERAPPRPVRYDLEAAYPGLLANIADTLEQLSFAPLEIGGAGAADLVRIGLLKRLESSTTAFRASIRRQIRFLEAFLDALASSRLLAPREHRALHVGDGDAMQLLLTDVALRPIPPSVDADAMEATARADLERLRRIERRIPRDPNGDPKIERLLALLDGELAGRKVVLFTEFRDTARALLQALHRRGGVALVDGEGAFLGLSPCGRRTAIERFAPRANHAPPPPAHERVDLLIATDVLSEGLNLQDAECVISYDLPWNPVRLIQRVGRIDRLGSPHDVVHSFHFLPDAGLDRLLRLQARLRRKLDAIGSTIGAEADVLGEGDVPLSTLVERLAAGEPDALDDIETAADPSSVWDERLLTALTHANTGSPTTPHSPTPLPPPGTTLLAFRAPRPVWLIFDPDTGEATEDVAVAASFLLTALEHEASGSADLVAFAGEDGESASTDHPLTPALVAARRALARIDERDNTAAAVPPHAPTARAARRLLNALANVPGGPAPDLCDRADRLLQSLVTRQDAGTEAALRDALRAPTPLDPAHHAETLVTRLEAVLAVDTQPSPCPLHIPEPRFLGALHRAFTAPATPGTVKG